MSEAQAWLYTAISLGLFAVTWRMNSPKWIWAVKPLFAFFAAAFFSQTGAGQPVANAILWFLDLVGGLIGVSGSLVAAGLVIVAIVVAVRDIAVDHVANTPAIACLLLLPLLGLIAAGPVADLVQNASERVAVAGSTGFERLTEGEG